MKSTCLRKVLFSVACLLLIAGTNAADGRQSTKPDAGTPAARLGREFKLKAKQQVTLKGESLRVKFAEVMSDSRCPADVKCIWAGAVEVRLEVSLRGRGRKSVTLTSMRESQPTVYRGYKISLVGVSPYPRSTGSIAPRDYVVTLRVSKE